MPQCRRKEYGYGTNNVNRRIQLMYGEKCGLQIFADEKGTTSRIMLSRKELEKTYYYKKRLYEDALFIQSFILQNIEKPEGIKNLIFI